MLESVQDLLYQKEKADTVSFDSKKADEAVFKRPKLPKKLNKKDISAPCNFKHVSGERVELAYYALLRCYPSAGVLSYCVR